MVKNKKLIVLILQLTLMGIFVIGTYSFSQKELKPTTVYQFAKKMNANAEIEVSDLRKVSIPQSAVDKNFLTEKEYKEIAEGNKVVATKVEAGQYVYSSQIIDGNKVDPFEKIDLSRYRKVTIPASFLSTNAGDIARGDRVDLAYMGNASGTNGSGQYTTIFMQNVLVYAVHSGDGFEYVGHSEMKRSDLYGTNENGEPIDTIDYEGSVDLITLAVPMEDVEEIIGRANSGGITIVGRFDNSVDVDAPGFFLGTGSSDASIFAGDKQVEKK